MSRREDMLEVLKPLVNFKTWLCVEAERAVSRTLGGSCSMPLAAHAVLSELDSQSKSINLQAQWGDAEHIGPLVKVNKTQEVHTLEDANALGVSVANEMIRLGVIVTQN